MLPILKTRNTDLNHTTNKGKGQVGWNDGLEDAILKAKGSKCECSMSEEAMSKAEVEWKKVG
jgi:hypothetical protein